MLVKHKIKVRRAPEYAIVLKCLREKRGMKQAMLAKKLGVSPMCISYYESGARVPRLDALDNWAGAVGAQVIITIDRV